MLWHYLQLLLVQLKQQLKLNSLSTTIGNKRVWKLCQCVHVENSIPELIHLILNSNSFHATDLFLFPWKHQKTSGFFMFSGIIERDQWHELG